MKERLPDLWGRFTQEGVADRIPNRADDHAIALYTDYESDDSGMYTIVLGVKVNSLCEPPEGMVVKPVPASDYAVFETGQKIRKDQTPDRSYRADFEVCGPAASNPRDGRIEIYVGVV